MRIFLALFAFLATMSMGCASAPQPAGTWQSVRHIDTWNAKVLTKDELKEKTKHGVLEITQAEIKLNNAPCKIYERKTFATDNEAVKWLYQNKIDYTTLHTRAPLFFIDTECTTVLFGADGKLFFDIDGEFYRARRVENRSREPAHK